MTPPNLFTDAFDRVPYTLRHRLVGAVTEVAATFPEHSIEDIIRWTVNAYVRIVQDEAIAGEIESAREDGYWSGREDGLTADESAAATEAKVKAGRR